MKLRKLHIDNYKMFKDFDIDFMDKDEKPLPIVVIAGINGSGKTTLLEYIFRDNILNIGPFYTDYNNYIEFVHNNEIKILNNEARKKKKEIDDYLKVISKKNGIASISYDDKGLFLYDLDKYITYIRATDDNIADIKKNILEYYRRKSRELDSHSKALKEIQSFVKNIFESLDLNFNIDDINDVVQNKEKVIFKNKMGNTFQIESLSTGEKILLSKILNLYFKDIKNQIILIDEPELSLHPAWQNKVLKLYENFAKENNCQIIIATHSPHIIASASHNFLRFLVEENGKIIAKQLDSSPLDRDINTIVKTIMGAEYIPEHLQKLHVKYRKLFDEQKLDTDEAKQIKEEILKYESPNSSFFQSIAFDMELMR